MAAAQPLFLTPPPLPRHLAELRIDTAPSAVAFTAPPCAAGAGRKRRCLLQGSSVRKRMLLELPPFGPAAPSPPPTPTPSSPAAPLAGGGTAPSPVAEFSFVAGCPVAPAATGAAGNMPGTPAGSEASSALSFLVPQGQPPTPASTAVKGVFVFLTAPELPLTPTGPTARGGFAFAAPPDMPLTPTGSRSNTGGCVSAVASTNQPLTPTGSEATSGFVAASSTEAFLKPIGSGAVASLVPAKPAHTATSTGTGSVGFAFPSTVPACAHPDSSASPTGRETITPAAPVTPSFVFSALRSPPPLRKSGVRSRKRPRPNLHVDTAALRTSVPLHAQCTPQMHKVAKTDASATGETPRSCIASMSTGRPCCSFFASPPKAAKQEAKNACTEVSRSPAGSRCASLPKPTPPEKPSKLEREVEVSSVACRGAEVVVRVTCKCGVHEEFTFDHRP